LAHFGIKGMHWGVRRKLIDIGRSDGAQKPGNSIYRTGKAVSDWGKEAGKLTKNNYRHPFLTSKAARASLKSDTIGNRLRRTMVYQNTKNLRDINKRTDKLVAQKAAQRALKKAEKAKMKDIKTQYRKEYMAGESKAGVIYARLTQADKIYANTMYTLNDKVNK
jgi:hypothetical protein